MKIHFSHSNTVKPEITHTLGGCYLLWITTGYGFFWDWIHYEL